MTFVLRVDGPRWRAHAADVAASYGDSATGAIVIPVVKGHGYGFGQDTLARESHRLGLPTLAVGTVFEALDPQLQPGTAAAPGSILVLTPYESADSTAEEAWDRARQLWGDRLITTVGSPTALSALATAALTSGGREVPRPVVIEGLTSTCRFGIDADALPGALAQPDVERAVGGGLLRLAGLALHLPMAQPDPARTDSAAMLRDPVRGPQESGSGRVREAAAWGRAWLALLSRLSAADGPFAGADLGLATDLWVSHLSPAEVSDLRGQLPAVAIRPRVGTRLWLGEPDALRAEGVVLAVHPITGGTGGIGYRQRRLRPGSHLIVVGGGTSHGVALAAPDPNPAARRRAANTADALLQAAGRARSPFVHDGHHLLFAETPHASVSLLNLPRGSRPPGVGESLTCRVRNTTTRFDRIIGLEQD